LVPDFVIALTRPPAKLPWRTSNGATSTWNSCTASSEIGLESTCPPGAPVDPMANRSVLMPPSIWMLLYRLFCPAIVMAPSELLDGVAWGEVVIRSVKFRPCSGRVRMALSLMV
jgi:hypothetical protein